MEAVRHIHPAGFLPNIADQTLDAAATAVSDAQFVAASTSKLYMPTSPRLKDLEAVPTFYTAMACLQLSSGCLCTGFLASTICSTTASKTILKTAHQT